jgi:hypothetical protein
MALSSDGVHFEKPNLGVIPYQGSTDNNIVLTEPPVQGGIFKDGNPNILPEERFKLTAFSLHRGIFLYVSPDGINWRRNETIMLPFDCGGGVETFWDDQRGEYFCHLRHEGGRFGRGPGGDRRTAMARTNEIFKPWPFKRLPNPALRKAFTLACFTEELPTPVVKNENGEPYRTRAIKYEWAPDAYFAFIWRLGDLNIRQTELAVSRDGIDWKFYTEPIYFPHSWMLNGKKVLESMSVHGLIRRGDELWQYATAEFAIHARATPDDRLLLYKQRLDGFVSLTAGDQLGTALTRPLVFDGNRLELNIAAQGRARVALADEAGQEIEGYRLTDCDPIRSDSVRHRVTWKGKSDVSDLAGQVVRVRFAMRGAKLFAMQFVKSEG